MFRDLCVCVFWYVFVEGVEGLGISVFITTAQDLRFAFLAGGAKA